MFFLKYKLLISLLKKQKLEESHRLAFALLKKYPKKPQIYVTLAKIFFKKDDMNNAKKTLLNLIKLRDWYKQDIVKEILEITNWKLLYPNMYYCRDPKFSYDGEKIVFVCAKKDTNGDGVINNSDCGGIYIIDRETKKIQQIVDDNFYNYSPSFSPDGKFLCYFSTREDTNGDGVIDFKDATSLYIFDLIKGEEKLLLKDIYGAKNPNFSPDGKKIVFSCWLTPFGKSAVYEINLKTLEINRLTDERYESVFPSYSPCGRYIVFSSFRQEDNIFGGPIQKSGIYIKDLVIDKEEAIVEPKYISSYPVFSNNGKLIAYLSKRRDTNKDGVIDSLDNNGIYVFDIEKKKEYCIHSDSYFNKFINFSYDSKYIVFLSSWHSKKKQQSRAFFEYKGIYMIDINNKHLKQIVSDKYFGCTSLNVSPKRYEVVYTSFRKNTLRGLYLAYLFNLPTKDEIVEIINKNF